ncbi:MAG: NAD(P)-dependent oxidoreductase [Robiginitomaculum sp.]|nr:NAD(P)-dependent oxidoreductase [Robiginitomaculum sp.]MDQ7078741.1 NAD(P)-dependent oxidoreductase [Robiginitomaculum sp.]
MSLSGKTVFITGASRGIGLAIAKRCAQEGANIVIAAKSAEPHPSLPGTIYTAADEVRAAGGEALPLVCDIRFEDQVENAVARAVSTFGGIDILVNNASAIFPRGVLDTPMKRFDLMHQVNMRGTYLTTQKCLPHLMKAQNPHVLMLSPPLDMQEKWFAPHTAYTMAKFGMSLCVLGMAGEFREEGVAFNALWPRTAIATAAIANILAGEEGMKMCRTPEILADAAYLVFTQNAPAFSGNFLIDDTFLYEHGVTDFTPYLVDPAQPLLPDFFVPEEGYPAPPGVKVLDVQLGQ